MMDGSEFIQRWKRGLGQLCQPDCAVVFATRKRTHPLKCNLEHGLVNDKLLLKGTVTEVS